tara:strand:- start:827 stop:2956 length:2130 start_codon:yes stop_codon:yes gene_type:complete
MKISKNKLKKVIAKSLKDDLIFEASEDAYARFVYNMEKLALFSEKSASMRLYKTDNPELFKRMKALGQKIIKRIQGDFPGTIDLDSLNNIISSAKEEKRKDPSVDYGAKVIEYANDYWFDNIGASRSADAGHGGHSLLAADPRARGEVAKTLDRTLKYAWKEEANQPENKKFWDDFEVWHAIGGIVGERGTVNHATILGFLESFKTSNPHEMSAYGWDGTGNTKSDSKKMNLGITQIINSESGWKDKVHVKLDGEITFAANFDITTQWFSYKEDDESDFEKAGDLNKMIQYGKHGSMITGPKDKLLGGMDKYNEIVIKDSKVVAIAFPEAFFKEIKDMGEYRVVDMSLLSVARLIKEGDIDQANKEILEATKKTGLYSGSNWYAGAVHQLIDAMAAGDKSLITDENRIINVLKYISKYIEYDIEIYHVNGASKKDIVVNFVNAMKICIDFIENNPALKSRKELNWYEWLSLTRSPVMKEGIDALIKYIKDDTIKNFIMSEEGDDFFYEQFRKLKLGSYYFNPREKPKYKKLIFNPKSLLDQKVPYRYMRKDASMPVNLYQLAALGIAMSKSAQAGIPPFISAPSSEPANKPMTNGQKIIMPPYFVSVRWKDSPKGEEKSYQDDVERVFGFRSHQKNHQEIVDMLDGIVNKGGEVIYFGVYDKSKRNFIGVKNKNELQKLMVPVMPTRNIAEIKSARSHIRKLLQELINQ